ERALLLAVRDFRKALRRATRGANHQDRTAANFATEVLQKRLLSGPWAFGQSWLALTEGMARDETASAAAVGRVRDVAAADTDDDAERESRQRHADRTVGAWMRQWKDAVADELAEVGGLVDAVGVGRVAPGLDPASHQAEVKRLARQVKADARLRSL